MDSAKRSDRLPRSEVTCPSTSRTKLRERRAEFATLQPSFSAGPGSGRGVRLGQVGEEGVHQLPRRRVHQRYAHALEHVAQEVELAPHLRLGRREDRRQQPQARQQRQQLRDLPRVGRAHRAVPVALLQQRPIVGRQDAPVGLDHLQEQARIPRQGHGGGRHARAVLVRLVQADRLAHLLQGVQVRPPAHSLKRVVRQEHPVADRVQDLLLGLEMVVDRALRHPAQRVHDVLNRRLLIALFQKEALGGRRESAPPSAPGACFAPCWSLPQNTYIRYVCIVAEDRRPVKKKRPVPGEAGTGRGLSRGPWAACRRPSARSRARGRWPGRTDRSGARGARPGGARTGRW